MKRIIKSEAFIITLLATLALTLNAYVWFVKAINTPPGREFIPIHNSLSDYPFYTSVIKQGMEGGRLVFDRFALEQHQGSVLHVLYLALGWVGGMVGIQSTHVVYHIARFILGAMWCMVMYWLCDTMIHHKKARIVAFFFMLFSASFPRFVFEGGTVNVSWFMTWWSELDPIVRAAFVPHFTVGHIAMVASLISIVYYERSGGGKWLFRGALSAWVAAAVHPPSFIQIAMIVPLYVLIVRRKHWVLGSLAVLAAGGIGLVHIYQASSVFPWNQPKEFERINFAVPIAEYLLGLGPVVLLALAGAVAMYKKKELWILIIWIVTSIVMIPVAKAMPASPIAFIRDNPIANIRFLQVALWVPLGILAAFGLEALWRRLGRNMGVAIIVVFLGLTFIGYPDAIKNQINHMYFSYDYTYPKVGYIKGVKALDDVTKPDQITLSLSLGGVTTPMYINRTAYVGQVVYTPDREVKLKRSWEFFHGDMSVCEAYRLLKDNRVGSVLYSFDEQNAGNAIKLYPFLQPWNTYGETTIYTFVDSLPVGCN